LPPVESPLTAVMLAKHYGARQICAWRDGHADVMNGHDFQSKRLRLNAA
jgi:hypothetical protein